MASSVVGVKSGDQVKYQISYTHLPAGVYLEWIKQEIASVVDTIVVVRRTDHLSNGTELNQTVPFDVLGTTDTGLEGSIIPANSSTGAQVQWGTVGKVTIIGETIRQYVGVDRIVLYGSLTHDTDYTETLYWDKYTGVLVEWDSLHYEEATFFIVAETNIIPEFSSLLILPLVLIATLLAIIAYRRKRPWTNSGYPYLFLLA
jgi:hypothetical protein